jgi:hypothetical protein
MPFENCIARVFTNTSIYRDAPAVSGVYGISNAREWIYVGETDNIQARLMEHLQEDSTLLTDRQPTGFAYETCPPYSRIARQSRLVQELEPVCNRRPEQRRPDRGTQGRLTG